MLVYGRNVAKDLLKKNKNIRKVIIQDTFDDKEIKELLENGNFNIEKKTKREIDNLCSGVHQGIILDIPDYQYSELDDLLNEEIIVILDHLEDPHNLGAIIRTVEASGIDGIIIPKNRTVSVNETVMKTSVGALFNVRICQVTNLNQTIKTLKKNDFWIIGTDMDGEDFQSVEYPEKSVLIIGSEGFGISRLVKESCDYVVSIPMNGKINSLNASVACGIMIYELIRKK